MSWDIPKLIKARRGFSIYYRGKTLLSNIDPIAQAQRIIDSFPVKDRTLYFCPSPLFGYGLENLLMRITESAPNSAVLCVEEDEHLFRLSQENLLPLGNNKRLALCSQLDKAALSAFVRQKWGERCFRRIETVRLNGGWQLFPEIYQSLEETLREEIALDWSNALILTKLGRLYIRNAMRNLALITNCPSISALSFGSTPVLVLGAGPSLDKLLEKLILHFGNDLQKPLRPLKIICVDTCLGALKVRNIKPDLAVILESQYWNLRDFIGLGGWNISSAVDLSAFPVSAKLPDFMPYLFFTPWTELRIFRRLAQAGLLPESFQPLGSVGLTAAAIALRLTKGPVFIGGMDFSFSLDLYHTRCTGGHSRALGQHNRFRHLFNTAAFDSGCFDISSKNGNSVRSNPVMRNYRNLFEQEFSAESRLFDVSSGGLPLGIKTICPEDFIRMLEEGSTAADSAVRQGAWRNLSDTAERLIPFIRAEMERLIALRNILTGAEQSADKLESLIDECDYLWAHFPDYAGTGGRRPGAEELSAGTAGAISFLKRLRAEIDPIQKIYEKLVISLTA